MRLQLWCIWYCIDAFAMVNIHRNMIHIKPFVQLIVVMCNLRMELETDYKSAVVVLIIILIIGLISHMIV